MGKILIEKVLSNTATPAEIEKFERWLNESNENQHYFSQCKTIWNALDRVYVDTEFDLKTAKAKIEEKIVKQSKKRVLVKRPARWAMAAASILLLLGISFLLRYSSNQASTEVLATATHIEQVVLKDGSHVWLNKNSTLRIPLNFSKNERTVYLKGEAYFEVKRDEKMPFKVVVGKTVTEVLGTSFNIHHDSITQDVDLGVTTGRVAFYKRKDKKGGLILLAGDQAQYKKDKNAIQKPSSIDLNYLSWKTGELKFDETPLEKVCADLSRFYGVRIETVPQNEKLTLTGCFRDEKLENILSSIELTLDVEINYQNQTYIVLKP